MATQGTTRIGPGMPIQPYGTFTGKEEGADLTATPTPHAIHLTGYRPRRIMTGRRTRRRST